MLEVAFVLKVLYYFLALNKYINLFFPIIKDQRFLIIYNFLNELNQ